MLRKIKDAIKIKIAVTQNLESKIFLLVRTILPVLTIPVKELKGGREWWGGEEGRREKEVFWNDFDYFAE